MPERGWSPHAGAQGGTPAAGGGALPAMAGRSRLRGLAAGLAAAFGWLLELTALRLAIAGGPLVPALLAHLAAAVLVTPALVRATPEAAGEDERAEALFAFVHCLFLPVLGPLLVLVLHAIVVRLPRHEAPGERFIVHRTAAGKNATGILEAPLEAPLLDLLRVLDVERRRRAVLSLSDLDPRRSIPILREALRDPDEEVRLFAYGILSAHEDHLNRQILALLASISGPQGAGEASAAVEARLGDLYHEFGYLGLAGSQIQRFYLGRAVECYERSLMQEPEQPRVLLKLARVFVRLRLPDRAEEALVAAILGGLPVVETMPWQAEVYFLRGEQLLMQGLLQVMRREPAVPERMRRPIAFWRTA